MSSVQSVVVVENVNVVEMFDASVFVSEQLNRLMINAAQELAIRAVDYCGNTYGFDAEEARRVMNLMALKVARKAPIREKQSKNPKEKQVRAAFPLPYSGECNPTWCNALRQNCGLYTQCQSQKAKNCDYCKTCNTLMQKAGSDMPEYGTIGQRQAVGIFEYTDPKGRKPIAYTKVMKKYKQDKEAVLAEAAKLGQTIDDGHFEVIEEPKRGRKPSAEKASEKSAKAGGKKGRPKKAKVIIQIDGDDGDLFANLVASANDDEASVSSQSTDLSKAEKEAEKEAKKEAERLAREEKKKAEEAAKAEKEAKRAQEKAEKEAQLAQEKKEKEAKKEAERLLREEKKKAEEAAKAEKEALRLKEKEEREAKKKAEAEAKASKPKAKKAEEEEEEEPDRVKSITFEDKKYLKSLKSGLIYDYEKGKLGDFIVIGKWENDKVVLTAAEESEDEYDDEE